MADASATRASNSVVEASEAIGWDATIYDTHASPTEANDKLLQAVTTGVDAIVLVGLDPQNIGSGLAAAQDADIPIACIACWGKTQAETDELFVTAAPTEQVLTDLGRASAEFAFQEADGHPKFLAMNDPSLTNLQFRQNGFDQFVEDCQSAGADCQVLANQTFQYANTFTTLAAEAASLAQAHPDFNAFWAGFDVAAVPIMSGLTQAGLTNNGSFLVGSQGDGANVEIIADGGYQKATVAISWEWAAYGVVDNFNRYFAGEEPIDVDVPIRLFIESNVADAKGGAWDGDVDFRSAFEAIWNGQ
jgi:ribose transport system substrate-binding protein